MAESSKASSNQQLSIYDPPEQPVRFVVEQPPSIFFPFVSAVHHGVVVATKEYKAAAARVKETYQKATFSVNDFTQTVPKEERNLIGSVSMMATFFTLHNILPAKPFVKRWLFVSTCTAVVGMAFYPHYTQQVFKAKIYPGSKPVTTSRTPPSSGGPSPFQTFKLKIDSTANTIKDAIFPKKSSLPTSAPATVPSETIADLFPSSIEIPTMPVVPGVPSGGPKDKIKLSDKSDASTDHNKEDIQPDYGQSNLDDLSTYSSRK